MKDKIVLVEEISKSLIRLTYALIYGAADEAQFEEDLRRCYEINADLENEIRTALMKSKLCDVGGLTFLMWIMIAVWTQVDGNEKIQ